MVSVARTFMALFIGILATHEVLLAGEASPAYAKAVMTAVSAKVEYPKMAKLRHQEGVVTVQITVDGTGKPTVSTVAQSSGSQSLDDAALAAVNAAAPFPTPPGPDTIVQGNIRFTAE